MKRLAFVLLLLAGCNRASADPSVDEKQIHIPAATATRVETAVLERSPASLRLTLPGEIEGIKDARLASSMGGYVEAVHVKAGQKVKAGKVLLRVDTATAGARRKQARVELETAEREYERAQKLAGVIPQAELDMAQSRLLAAQAALGTTGVQVARSVITAPFSGTVVDVATETGEVAVPGAPLVRVVQLDPVKVSVSLSDRDVVALTEGMEATVSTEARGARFKGQVTHIHRAADLRTRSFLADIEVPNPDGSLLPGMIASVEVDVAVAKDEIVVSQDWLVTKTDQIGVFLNRKDRAAWQKVELGPVVGNRVVVSKGIKPGDELVMVGHRELADGDDLLVVRKGTCCTAGRVTYK